MSDWTEVAYLNNTLNEKFRKLDDVGPSWTGQFG